MVDGRLTNSPQEIIEMWFNHFKILGSFGQDISFDENFRDHVTTSVLRELSSDLNHDENLKSLNKQIELSEIVSVCKDLTDGTQGELIKLFMNMLSMVVPTCGKYFMFFTIRCLTVQVFHQDGNDFTTFQG